MFRDVNKSILTIYGGNETKTLSEQDKFYPECGIYRYIPLTMSDTSLTD